MPPPTRCSPRSDATIARSVKWLLSAGFLQKEQGNYEQCSHHPRAADEFTGEMQRTLNDWYAKVGQLVSPKYSEKPATPTAKQ